MCVVKLLKWMAMVINSILLTTGIIIAIFGVIMWKTDLNTFGDEVMKTIPKSWQKETGTPPEAPPIFQWLGKLVLSFGLFIVGLSIFGIFALCCCSDKCKLCLIIYLVILIILLIVQAAITGLSYNTATLRKEVEKAIKPVFLDPVKRKSSSKFIMGTQTFLKCCAVNGYKDYYCADVYDPFCNFGCKDPIPAMKKELPVCLNPKAANVKKTTGVCKDAAVVKGAKYPGEPQYSDIPGMLQSLLKKKDGGIAKKPSDFLGCTEMIFGEIDDKMAAIQITCIVILCVEAFLMLVTILLICKQKASD